MLQSLHVKNLALIEETEVEFGPGLNILTGETGAGKSLLLGSVNLALGAKFEKDMLRTGAEYALVELTFSGETDRVKEKLAQMDVESCGDGSILITRKMQAGKSTCKINGETVTAKQVKELAEVLLDIHGQHEHQSLLNKKNHLTILDDFCGEAYGKIAEGLADSYAKVKELKRRIEEETMDEAARLREEALARFELEEIENARLIPGEDEELEKKFRLMNNSKKIVENLGECYQYTGSESREGAANGISRALRSLMSVSNYDEHLQTLEEQLSEIENLLSDFNHDLVDFMEDCEFDDETYSTTEARLDELGRLKGKYGNTIEACIQYGKEKQAYLDKLADYDTYMSKLQAEYDTEAEKLRLACKELSKLRCKEAKQLEKQLVEALQNLNFLSVSFEIAVRPEQNITAKGWDEVEFMISTNPGEPIKSLSQVASGGELSRIMLAIKTVLAGRDDIDTLIFDEIDTGISGKTAWKVSEQLDTVAHAHQVICITHLPQIAAMADHHFCIEKSSHEQATITDIRALDGDESLAELARLLGSDELSEAALQNASDMRKQALAHKQ